MGHAAPPIRHATCQAVAALQQAGLRSGTAGLATSAGTAAFSQRARRVTVVRCRKAGGVPEEARPRLQQPALQQHGPPLPPPGQGSTPKVLEGNALLLAVAVLWGSYTPTLRCDSGPALAPAARRHGPHPCACVVSCCWSGTGHLAYHSSEPHNQTCPSNCGPLAAGTCTRCPAHPRQWCSPLRELSCKCSCWQGRPRSLAWGAMRGSQEAGTRSRAQGSRCCRAQSAAAAAAVGVMQETLMQRWQRCLPARPCWSV